MDDVLVFLHLLGAALWLGGLATLALVIAVAYRSLERAAFLGLVRRAGWAFAALSAAAWALLAGPGLALAFERGWPALAIVKAVLGGVVIAAAVTHVWTGRRRDSRALVMASRTLSALIFGATLALFWLGVRLAG